MKKLLRRQNQFGPIEKAEFELLNDRLPGDGCNKFVINAFNYERAKKAWDRFGTEIMEKWLNKNTKPHNWYLFESPILPKFANPEWPIAWAVSPELIPSEAKQKAFLDSLK
jgi:hypothetical protein